MENKNKRTILVFNHSLAGHRVEFFHHLYLAAINKDSDRFVFSYPKSDGVRMPRLEWPQASNIVFKHSDISLGGCGALKSSFRSYRALKKTIKDTKPDAVVLTDIMFFMPFVCLLRNVSIKGLIGTGIFLYTWKDDSLLKRLENYIKYFLFAKCKLFNKIYMQCDPSSALYLNKYFKTSKFEYICDPVPRLSTSVNDLRKELSISPDKIIVLHPGDLSNRKGSLELLKGIRSCSKDTLSKYCFIFAGGLSSEIKIEFYKLLSEIQQKTEGIHLIEGFVSFDYLASLVFTCDLLFLPYNVTNQSSGIVGYGAEYNKPVIVTNKGLLGKIVRKYNLGYIIPDNFPETITHFLTDFREVKKISGEAYLSDNTVKEFAETMID